MTSEPEPFQHLLVCLRAQNLNAAAKILDERLTCVYTTSSEFLGEVGLALLEIRRQYGKSFAPETREAFRGCMRQVHGAWPQIGFCKKIHDLKKFVRQWFFRR